MKLIRGEARKYGELTLESCEPTVRTPLGHERESSICHNIHYAKFDLESNSLDTRRWISELGQGEAGVIEPQPNSQQSMRSEKFAQAL
jgi:hypothetical protein